MFTLKHKIGGITFSTESDVRVAPLQTKFFQQFLVEEAEPDVHQRIRCVDPDFRAAPDLISKTKELLSRCIGAQTKYFDIPLLSTPPVVNRLESCLGVPEQVGLELNPFMVIIRDHIRKEVNFFYLSEVGVAFGSELSEVRFPVFRRMFTSFIPAYSTMMVHSACLIRKGRAILFLAPDEGGKTTVVDHSYKSPVLSDDMVMLRKQNGSVFAHGTPWGKISHGPLEKQVAGFFLLEQSERFELTPLKPMDAVEFFWREHLNYRVFLPMNLRVKAFEVIYSACHQAPVYRMRFPKDFVDWQAIDSVLEV